MNIYRVHQQKDKKIMKNKSASYFFDPMLDFRRHIPVFVLKLQKWTVGINASNLCLGCVSVFSWFRFYTIITLSIYALWTKSENLENIPPPPCLKLQKYDPASPPSSKYMFIFSIRADFLYNSLMIVQWVDIQYKINPCWWSQLYRTELARQFVQR